MSCPDGSLQDLDLASFYARLRPPGLESDVLPLSGSIELTRRCNLRCRHCYVSYPGAPRREMTLDQVRGVVDQLAANGALLLLLTGAEPLARKDFKDIYLHVKRAGLLPTLFTNATLVTEEVADFLAAWPPRKVEISVYGFTEATYETITGVAGCFAAMRRGIVLLRDRGLPLRLKTMVMKSNLHEFEDLKRWAEELGIRFRYDPIINPRLDGGLESTSERLTPEEAARIAGASELDRSFFVTMRDRIREGRHPYRLLTCGAGIKTFHVDAQGRLHPCMLWRYDGYDLLKNRLDGAWKQRVAELRSTPDETGPCTTCELYGICGRCAPLSRMETGDPAQRIPYHCAVGEARARLLIPLPEDRG
jgi:radical SAM protein with 4Fe4S-binding SPASM domain